MKLIIRIFAFIFMFIIVPMDYIGWNLFYGKKYRKMILTDIIKNSWRNLTAQNIKYKKNYDN